MTEVESALSVFRNKLWDEISFNVASNGSVDCEELLVYVTKWLEEADEIEEFTYLPYEGIGKRNKKMQIDGYAYSELDECLSIFVVLPMNYDESEVLTATEANRFISMAAAFLDNAEFILEKAEESSPGYGFAYDIIHRYGSIQKYKIFLVTDREKSKSLTQLEEISVRGKQTESHVWDLNRLYDLVNSSMGREEIIIRFAEFGIYGIPCLLASSTDDYKAYLCNMPGAILATLYNKYGSRLLEGNVRSFLQVKGKVNKGIRATILNEPERFFAYNNGIAATAYDANIEIINGTPYITELRSMQIVNGGQTTASLATALLKDKKDNSEACIEKINIPMKLSIVQPDKAAQLIANIARYANSQNKVSDADLWSNHPFHIRMEDFSRRIIAPATNGRQYGTYWYYERTNGQYNQETYKSTPREKARFAEQHPLNQKITKTELAKYMHVFQQRPDIAGMGGQKAFTTFAEEVSKKWDKDNLVFNEDYYRNLVAIALLFREADRIVRKQTWYRSYKANIVEYSLSKIFYTVENDYPDKAINLKTIWQKQTISQAWIKQLEGTTYEIYQYLIREDRDIENVTEWAKRERCWAGAKQLFMKLMPEFVNELQDKYDEMRETKDARQTQKLTNKLSSMVDVVNYGVDGWEKLLLWNADHRILSPAELHLIKMSKNMDGSIISSEKQCERVLKILEKCRVEGFPG